MCKPYIVFNVQKRDRSCGAMSGTLFSKIIETHVVEGSPVVGQEIGVRIDQTLVQDATGTMAYLQFEALQVPRVKTRLSVTYIDHNTLQTGFENADDHIFLASFSKKYGMYYSRAGNGVCHQVHLERFSVPGETLLGADSHTTTCGGVGMVAIGAGGLDVAAAMAGEPYSLTMPKVLGVHLLGRLRNLVSSKDLSLELLRRLTVKGGVGKVLEYHGEGVSTLSVPERATCTNMGTETGATTSIFPSDSKTKEFLAQQGRPLAWKNLEADPKVKYDEDIDVDLTSLKPMVARPHSPDNVCAVKDIEGTKLDQVVIGSCTNSSYQDLMKVASILQNHKINADTSLVVAPGSKQVLEMIAENGALATLIGSGARVLEPACGPCIGMGQAPRSGGTSLRTINRNFEGRSGTKDAKVFLASPETAAVSAINGEITDPTGFGSLPEVEPSPFTVDDSMILAPASDLSQIELVRGPNIKPLPLIGPLPNALEGEVLIKVGDNITTDHIMPAGAKILPFRSNIPAISNFVFERIDPEFASKAREKHGGFILAGDNYGQGSSREHAALAPAYLGIRVVIAKSFARIHKGNLVNFGVLPLTFATRDSYEKIEKGDFLHLTGLTDQNGSVTARNIRGETFELMRELTDREIEVVSVGGLLNSIKGKANIIAQ
jgi:aconitate hydratase